MRSPTIRPPTRTSRPTRHRHPRPPHRPRSRLLQQAPRLPQRPPRHDPSRRPAIRSTKAGAHRQDDPRDCRQGPGPAPPVRRGTRSPRRVAVRPSPPAEPRLSRSPTGEAPPSRAAGSGERAPHRPRPRPRPFPVPFLVLDRRERRGRPRLRGMPRRPSLRQSSGRPSARSRAARPLREHAPPRAAPNPGTLGRRGTRSTGSRPPGGRARVGRVATRRSIDGGGRGSSIGRRGRLRTRRTDKPGHRPCWAALAQSSGR